MRRLRTLLFSARTCSVVAPVGALLSMISTQALHASSLTVILDAGHGGDDHGAVRRLGGKTIAEKEITLNLARLTKRYLLNRGARVILTRSKDNFIGLDQRVEIANQVSSRSPSTVFVSIHANSNVDARSSGIETYVFNATNNEASRRLADLENGKRFQQSHEPLELIMSDLATTANYAESVKLACAIQSSVVSGLKEKKMPARNRGIHQALFYVLMQTRMPGILFEPGFISNPQELLHLMTPSYQNLLAQRLGQGILDWWRSQRQKRALASTHSHQEALKISGISKTKNQKPNWCFVIKE
ncbi:MAG: N-acetylmuramoyl-L-alanine amidase [Bdellovibrionota bacterium]